MADARFEQLLGGGCFVRTPHPPAVDSAQRGEYTEVQDRLLLSTMEYDGAPILALDS